MKSLLWSPLLLAILALPLAAQPGPRGRGSRVEQIGRTLNLTEAQKANLRTLREKHHQDLILRRDAVAHARIDLRTALQETTTPDVQLRALYDKAAAARFDLILARRALQREVQALLTPEQRARAAELRGLARDRRQERMRRLGPGPGMPG
jgi:Spy/CpxP family protein refolding chaperone